jgi:hypothetical protein
VVLEHCVEHCVEQRVMLLPQGSPEGQQAMVKLLQPGVPDVVVRAALRMTRVTCDVRCACR